MLCLHNGNIGIRGFKNIDVCNKSAKNIDFDNRKLLNKIVITIHRALKNSNMLCYDNVTIGFKNIDECNKSKKNIDFDNRK